MTKKTDAEILFFTGVKRNQPVPIDYPALLKMAVEALEALVNAADCMTDSYNSSMCDDELNVARATLEAIRKAGVK